MTRNERLLRYATLVYAIGLVTHNGDHFRRGIDVLTRHVFWAGNFSTLVGIILIALVATRHRWAPLLAAAFGIPAALGVAAVHLLPRWSAFSDAFLGGRAAPGVTGVSWTVVLIEIAGMVGMGLAGLAVLREHGWFQRSRSTPLIAAR